MPAGQISQLAAAGTDAIVPGEQREHSARPVSDAYMPTEHGSQSVIPALGATWPSGHAVQLPAPGDELDVPGAQRSQASLRQKPIWHRASGALPVQLLKLVDE